MTTAEELAREMTNDEAAAILESEAEYLYSQDEPYNRQAFKMAIEALKQKPVLDKIRAEIVDLQKEYQEYGWAYDDALEIIDKYIKADKEE